MKYIRPLWGVLLLELFCFTSEAALLCDGIDDRVVTANVTGVPTGYPLSVGMVLQTPSSPNAVIFAAGTAQAGSLSGYSFFINAPTGTLAAYNYVTGDVFGPSTGTIPTNTWVFVGWASASATSHRLYAYNYATHAVIFDETFTATLGAITAPGGTAKLCAEQLDVSTFGTFFPGTLRWMATYTSTLSSNAFLAMATLGPYASATPTLLYDFNEMAGTTVRERRGTGNAGTMTNFPGSPWLAMGLPGPLLIP